MKILKKAEQKNFTVNTDYYHNTDLNDLFKENAIDTLDICGDFKYVVYAANAKDIKVFLDEYGYYTNVFITKQDKMIYISL